MSILEILQTIGTLGTIITGIIALVRPLAVTGFTGIKPEGPRGISEIRAVLGGLFIGVGAAVLFVPEPGAAKALGFAYLGTAIARLYSVVADKSRDRSNLISAAWEIFFGVVLVL
jgi:hypothetical protein